MGFQNLSSDLKLLIISFLAPSDIFNLRLTCRTLCGLSKESSVWISQCKDHIISRGYPFPNSIPLAAMSTPELERAAFNSYRVSQKWISMVRGDEDVNTRKLCDWVSIFRAHNDSVAVREIFFLPRGIHGRNLVLTVSKKVWSVIRVWEITPDGEVGDPIGEWGLRGVLFKTIAVNSDRDSKVTVAIGIVAQDAQHSVQFLNLTPSFSFEPVCSLETKLSPLTLKGEIVALCDAKCKTAIFNWATSGYALLDDDDTSDTLRANYVHQVAFAHESVIVARFHSLTLFAMPELRPDSPEDAVPHMPLSKFEFSTQDGMRVSLSKDQRSCKILMREDSDPWKSRDEVICRVYDLPFNPAYPNPLRGAQEEETSPPYSFPPVLKATIPTSRGRLVAREIRLGKCGTALWVKPKPWRGVAEGLVTIPYSVPEGQHPNTFMRPASEEEREKEYLMGTVLWDSELRCGVNEYEGLGSMRDEGPTVLKSFLIKTNRKWEDWTCMDYDEETGMFALGHEDGMVTLCAM